MMKNIFRRTIKGFLSSAVIATICLTLIEICSSMAGNRISPMTPEFISYFPSETIAIELDILLYGIFGAVFSTFSFLYEIDRLGFVLQNIIYCVCTALFWIPIITFIWQLWKYPAALISTVIGFIMTYVIITIITYNSTKKNINELNKMLDDEKA